MTVRNAMPAQTRRAAKQRPDDGTEHIARPLKAVGPAEVSWLDRIGQEVITQAACATPRPTQARPRSVTRLPEASRKGDTRDCDGRHEVAEGCPRSLAD